MDGNQREVNEGVDHFGKIISPEMMTQISGAVRSITEGNLPKEALGYSNERLAAIYDQAYRLYNTGKFLEADHLFRALILLDPTEYKYYYGLAACLHMMKEYENAARVYVTASVVDSKNPVPTFHASDCYIQLRDRASAIIMLDMSVQRAGDRPEFQVLKERAMMTMENLKKELMEQFSGKESKEE